MAKLILLTQPHTRNQKTYAVNSILLIDDTTADFIAAASGGQIVTAATAWAAGSYPQWSVVTYNGQTWFANAAASSGDVPGTSGKWTVAVMFGQEASVGGGGGTANSWAGTSWKFENNILYANVSGTWKECYPSPDEAGGYFVAIAQ